MQVFFHHCVDDILGNWISQCMRDSTGTNTYFGSNVLFLPALEIKLNDLHVNRLQGLQWNVVGSGHGLVLIQTT